MAEDHGAGRRQAVQGRLGAAIAAGVEEAIAAWEEERARERAAGRVLYRGLWVRPEDLCARGRALRWYERRRLAGWLLKLLAVAAVGAAVWAVFQRLLLPG